MPQPIFRKDYEPSSHLIKTTELDFNLGDHETIVSSRIVFYKNPLRLFFIKILSSQSPLMSYF